MADGFTASLDTSQWDTAFAAMRGPVKESLMRRMLVEAGTLLRDAAKGNARMAANKEGVETRGLLAASIYLVFEKEDSTDSFFRYKISWNAKIAPHGHLLEFGHWQTHVAYKASNGEWYTRKDMPLDKPQWIAARMFLRPTIESYGNTAVRVALLRGEKELPKLMQEHGATA